MLWFAINESTYVRASASTGPSAAGNPEKRLCPGFPGISLGLHGGSVTHSALWASCSISWSLCFLVCKVAKKIMLFTSRSCDRNEVPLFYHVWRVPTLWCCPCMMLILIFPTEIWKRKVHNIQNMVTAKYGNRQHIKKKITAHIWHPKIDTCYSHHYSLCSITSDILNFNLSVIFWKELWVKGLWGKAGREVLGTKGEEHVVPLAKEKIFPTDSSKQRWWVPSDNRTFPPVTHRSLLAGISVY